MLWSQGDQLNCVREGKKKRCGLLKLTHGGILVCSLLQRTDRKPLWNAVKCRSFSPDGRPLVKGEYFKPLLNNHQATKLLNSYDENQMWVLYSCSMTTGLLLVGNDLFAFRKVPAASRCCIMGQNHTCYKRNMHMTE